MFNCITSIDKIYTDINQNKIKIVRGKNDFAKVSKNLARYRSKKNNFIGP